MILSSSRRSPSRIAIRHLLSALLQSRPGVVTAAMSPGPHDPAGLAQDSVLLRRAVTRRQAAGISSLPFLLAVHHTAAVEAGGFLYDPARDERTSVAPLPRARGAHAAATIDG